MTIQDIIMQWRDEWGHADSPVHRPWEVHQHFAVIYTFLSKNLDHSSLKLHYFWKKVVKIAADLEDPPTKP